MSGHNAKSGLVFLGNFGHFSGNFRQSAWAIFRYFQAFSGNFTQLPVVLGNFGGPKPSQNQS